MGCNVNATALQQENAGTIGGASTVEQRGGGGAMVNGREILLGATNKAEYTAGAGLL